MSTQAVALTSSEILLLRRALKFYAKEYLGLSQAPGKAKWEREADLKYMQAADTLCHKLLHGAAPTSKGERK